MTDDLPDSSVPFDDDDTPPACGRCGNSTVWCECDACGGEGVDGHDCGEDCCCCADPQPNVPCDVCGGRGGWWTCPSCAARGQDRMRMATDDA